MARRKRKNLVRTSFAETARAQGDTLQPQPLDDVRPAFSGFGLAEIDREWARLLVEAS
jgi:hypothetical protein